MTACPGPDRRRLIKRSIRDRFEDRYVVSADGCFIWTGATNRSTGYGSIGVRRKVHYAHRIAYELYVGPIPKGLVIDHLCGNRGCVNWRHLKAVTHRENILRGKGASAECARRSHCPRGHALRTDDALNKNGECARCALLRNARTKLRRIQANGISI